jgi:hypothetical protein
MKTCVGTSAYAAPEVQQPVPRPAILGPQNIIQYTNMAIENGPFIVGLLIKDGDILAEGINIICYCMSFAREVC